MYRRVFTLAAAAVLAAVPYDSIAAQRKKDPCADTTGWRFTVTPYVWASGILGDVGARTRTAHIDLSFRDILDNLDGAFMLPVELDRGGRIGIGGEVIYTKISADRASGGARFTGAGVSATQFIGELAPRIRVVGTKKVRVDVLFGTRMWYVDNSVTLFREPQPDIGVDRSKVWWDRFAGARAFYHFNDSWELQARADAGGFDAKSTWQAIGTVGYSISRSFTLRAGYRQLDVDYVEGGNGLIYDVGIGGPILGVSYKF